MNCEEYQGQIGRLTDREQHARDSTELFAHLGRCSSCREYLDDLHELGIALTMASRKSIAVNDAQRIWPRIPIKPQRSYRMRMVAFAAIICLSLVTGGLAATFLFSSHNATSERIVVCRLPAVVVTADAAASPTPH